MAFYKFKSYDGLEYGSFETFLVSDDQLTGVHGDRLEIGWYWWSCFPGCLPDDEEVGPFPTEQAAIDDAQELA